METRVCKVCGRELPVEQFKKTRWGDRVNVCLECDTEKRRKNRLEKKMKEIQTANEKSLSKFTPRELMEELARRGYKGKLTYTRVEEIDITNF